MFVRAELVIRPLICAGQRLYQDNSMKLLARFAADENGATAIEYGLIAALIAVAILATLQTIGSSMHSMYLRISNFLSAQG
jgi:pilus assembly protein Flp/PilA